MAQDGCGLDALGDDGEPEVPGEVDCGADDRLGPRVIEDVGDERAVDLDLGSRMFGASACSPITAMPMLASTLTSTSSSRRGGKKKRADAGIRTPDPRLTMAVPTLGVLPANRNVFGAWHVVCGGLSPQ
jgi:hypothetical protein